MGIEESLLELCDEVKGLKAEVTDSKRTAPESNGARKILAGIIATFIIGAVGTGAGMLIAHSTQIAVVETKVEANERGIGVVQADVKTLLSRVPE